MPYLDIRVANAAPDESARRTLGLRSTGLLRDILGKRAELTAVSITQLPASSWMIGERPQSESSRPAAHAEVTITSGTNTAEQKARFIAAMAALLRETFPGLHETTYVVVREVDAGSWGYDGCTQDARKRAGIGLPASAGTARAPASLDPAAQITRSASGAIDTEFYVAQAHRARSAAVQRLLRQLLAVIGRLPDALKIARHPANSRRPC